MKKLIFYLLIMMAAMFFLAACSPLSSISYGDRNIKNLNNSQKLIGRSITAYQSSIDQLKFENQKMINYLQDSNLVDIYHKKIAQNDSLIRVYSLRISKLESANDLAIIDYTNRKTNNIVILKGRNPYQIAEAYSVIRYINQSPKKESSGLKGAVANETYGDNVTIVVTGPANFYREFILGPKQESSVFSLPIPGIYTACSMNSFGDKACVSKEVGLNHKYYDSKGKKLDFFAAKVR